MRDTAFDRDRLREAFEHLGADLAARGTFLELAVYGGSAIMLQFSWRRGIEDFPAAPVRCCLQGADAGSRRRLRAASSRP